MVGEKYGLLEIVDFLRIERKNGQMAKIVKCQCECGNVCEKRYGNLKYNNNTRSCGCVKKEITRIKNLTHNQAGKKTRTREYISWSNMIQRTTNPNNPKYPLYGGINIGVCDEWRKFENFLKDMGKRPKGKSLERNNNKKGYYKENCSWATPKEQANNRGNKLK